MPEGKKLKKESGYCRKKKKRLPTTENARGFRCWGWGAALLRRLSRGDAVKETIDVVARPAFGEHQTKTDGLGEEFHQHWFGLFVERVFSSKVRYEESPSQKTGPVEGRGMRY